MSCQISPISSSPKNLLAQIRGDTRMRSGLQVRRRYSRKVRWDEVRQGRVPTSQNWRFKQRRLLPKQILHNEPNICRALREAAHVPREPVRAVRNQNIHGIARTGEALLFPALNSVEHLKFESVFRDAIRSGQFSGAGDQLAVLRGDSCTRWRRRLAA